MRESLVMPGQCMKVVCAASGYSAGHSICKYASGTLRRSMRVIYLGKATIHGLDMIKSR